jgi:hypothetical protein
MPAEGSFLDPLPAHTSPPSSTQLAASPLLDFRIMLNGAEMESTRLSPDEKEAFNRWLKGEPPFAVEEQAWPPLQALCATKATQLRKVLLAKMHLRISITSYQAAARQVHAKEWVEAIEALEQLQEAKSNLSNTEEAISKTITALRKSFLANKWPKLVYRGKWFPIFLS